MKINLHNRRKFAERHIGLDEAQVKEMLYTVGADSVEQLIEETVPQAIRLKKELDLPTPKSEYLFLKEFRKLASKNNTFRSFIGLGYYDCITPNVILRNILENPGWYTAYTPYQAEIAQGRLEMLVNFQTMVTELTGMEIANASLLDEATAAAEAMNMFFNLKKGAKKDANTFLVSDKCFPQTIAVLESRAEPLGIIIRTVQIDEAVLQDNDVFGVLLQYPDVDGAISDPANLVQTAHSADLLVAFAADLLSLTILTPPGAFGADAVVGSTQRFGVPMGFGGPHAAFFSTRDEYKRSIPGRIIGVSIDAQGKRAYRMALQTREQHIRRERATSNICTSQVLLAVIAAAFTVYHGAKGIRGIGERVHGMACLLERALRSLGLVQENKIYFDTLKIALPQDILAKLKEAALDKGINFRYGQQVVYISLDETTTPDDLADIVQCFAQATGKSTVDINTLSGNIEAKIPAELLRKDAFLQQDVFNRYHSEHEMLRYLKSLESKDLSLVHSMISLGSCTMKLNATTEMIPVTWPEFSSLHPFVPKEQAKGYLEMITELEKWLCEITGFAAISLQPNSGAQGEYAGLLVIRAFHESRGHGHRTTALIPSSAHGTNPASAVLAGFEVVVVKCDDKGNIDIDDLKDKAIKHKDSLGVLMVTYPSTHGVFEEGIIEICEIAHQNGAQVYMDGANMNAQVGLTSPANIGADVCHLNLHKTFCIPHGGGGPGMGPIGVASHLVEFLPGHPVANSKEGRSAIHAVSAAPFGSASILPISYAYISMMGGSGLKEATCAAILNANYMKSILEKHYPVLYSGRNGRCAHEFILDCRSFKQSAGVEVEDIAKRLMDYGFHAPTVSFPVAGTLMIEPTESESKYELDRFCEAMISIREEIRDIEEGREDKVKNVLKLAPHTAEVLMADAWDRPYGREKAAFPLPWVRQNKFWPSVSRVDNAYGDRNLICTCLPIEQYDTSVEPA